MRNNLVTMKNCYDTSSPIINELVEEIWGQKLTRRTHLRKNKKYSKMFQLPREFMHWVPLYSFPEIKQLTSV